MPRQPPAESSARISAVGAETGMRRYNARYAVIISCPLRGHEPPAESSARLSAAGAETGMCRYHARYAVIISRPLRAHEPPAELSARISAVNAEIGMRRYNARYVVIIPHRESSGKQFLYFLYPIISAPRSLVFSATSPVIRPPSFPKAKNSSPILRISL